MVYKNARGGITTHEEVRSGRPVASRTRTVGVTSQYRVDEFAALRLPAAGGVVHDAERRRRGAPARRWKCGARVRGPIRGRVRAPLAGVRVVGPRGSPARRGAARSVPSLSRLL